MTDTDHRRLERLHETLVSRLDWKNLDALEAELNRAHVVPSREVPPTVVTMNSIVEIVDLDTGEELQVTLVFPRAANLRARRISVLAPVGLALLGARVGDVVEWPTPGRTRRLRVAKLVYQPEAAGDFEL
jgi:regulator of nucleoside diphosphate kinase